MNKKVLFFLILTITFLSTACTTNNQAIFFQLKNDKIVEITNYEFYSKNDGSVFLFIMNKDNRDVLKSTPIKSVKIRFDETIIEGKVIEAAFSRELNNKPFICYTHNDGYVNFESFNKLELIYIGSVNEIPLALRRVMLCDSF
ncbi:hypothetical protein [Aquimarina litoralis]|uniref:hypothetical protein n=1 Tax=Aquimarina litoralis TaxID=584605 RepID=UPI001C58402E|nr:hypothetical protein [Aquimarina litoralis]MBW1298410.1 hypothetical protein [Aquimarina litoralis]